jgi:hypothetical protein
MARKQPIQILNEHHYDGLVSSLELLKDIREIMPKARMCGVNCDEYAKMADIAEESIDTILKTWFPKGRPK